MGGIFSSLNEGRTSTSTNSLKSLSFYESLEEKNQRK